MSLGSRMVTAYFVIGATMEQMSTSCTPSWRMPSGLPETASNMRSGRFTWPETNKTGVESSHAPATPVTALVPPGPVVTMQNPRPWLAFAYPSAQMAEACSCELQMGVMRVSLARDWFRCMAPPPVTRKQC